MGFIPGQNNHWRRHHTEPSSVEVLGESLRNEDAYHILKKEGWAPKNELAGREGVEVGVDVE